MDVASVQSLSNWRTKRLILLGCSSACSRTCRRYGTRMCTRLAKSLSMVAQYVALLRHLSARSVRSRHSRTSTVACSVVWGVVALVRMQSCAATGHVRCPASETALRLAHGSALNFLYVRTLRSTFQHAVGVASVCNASKRAATKGNDRWSTMSARRSWYTSVDLASYLVVPDGWGIPHMLSVCLEELAGTSKLV